MKFLLNVSTGTALGLILSCTCSAAAQAQTAEELAAKFGARESIRSISLSPEGKQIVFVAPRPDGGENAVVLNLGTSAAVSILSSRGFTEQISHCQFVLESRVVCQMIFRQGKVRDVSGGSRIVTISNDGKDMKMLSAKDSTNAYYNSNFGGRIIDYNVPGDPNAVLMTRWFPPEVQTGTLMGKSVFGLGVEKVDVVTGARKRVETPRESATDFVSDGLGTVRIMETQPTSENGYTKGQLNYSYRPTGGGGWTPLSKVTVGGGFSQGFLPVAVDSGANVAYGFDANGNFKALYKRSLDGSGTTSLVLGRSDADIDELIGLGRNQRIVGASYATEKRTVEYFDPDLRKLAAGLSRALGAGKQVSIIDATSDEGKLLIFAGSDTDPGKFYLFDKASKSLGELLPARPELAKVPMGTMKPVQYPAADGTMIPAYLTLPPGSTGKGLPAIVMPHGGPSARDEWGFDWLVQYFVARGFAVLQPNYRGSSGYGTAWFRNNGFKSWQTAIGDVNDAGRWLNAQGIAAPGKLAIFGWSYGGYAALQSAVVDPDLYKAVVAVAPVTDLGALREESREDADFYIVDSFIGSGLHVESGSPARHADRFKAPVLLLHGDADTNVGVSESRLMKGRLEGAGKQVEYIEFPNLAHSLDDAAARTRLLSASDRFLRAALGL
jgi:dipeptidyl aminopeptidase/acylaminoacyl peptidase